MTTVGVVTTSRADYSYLRPILRGLHDSPVVEPMLIVAGTHLSDRHGRTMWEIEEDGFPIAQKVSFPMEDDRPIGIARTTGDAVTGFAGCFESLKPDLVLILGDRFEVHAAASAATPFLIPLAHLYGGELTYGSIDDNYRHSITKLSHLHLTSTQTYARRILQMGEEDWRVTVCGATSLDNLRDLHLLDRSALAEMVGLDLTEDPVMMTYHPTTLDPSDRAVNNILEVLFNRAGPIIFTSPNADTGNDKIRRELERFVERHPNSVLVEDLGPQAYFSLLSIAEVMVGNSSSGIIEAPTFGLPVINVGDRQAGRVRGANVIDVTGQTDEIAGAMQLAADERFRRELATRPNPYGDGNAAGKIVRRLENLDLGSGLIRKRFIDIEATG